MSARARVLHHVAVTVPDVEEAVRFLVEAFGCETLLAFGPGPPHDEGMAQALDLPLGGSTRGLAILRAGPTLVELFTYDVPSQRRVVPGNADWGACHLAFEVDDVETEASRLVALGARRCGSMRTAQDPRLRGMQWAYFVAPFGLQLELVAFPDGPIDGTGGVR